jgi:hypothetical protein
LGRIIERMVGSVAPTNFLQNPENLREPMFLEEISNINDDHDL